MEDSISIDLDLEENVFSCSSYSSSLHPDSENEGNISDVYSTNGQNGRDMSDVSSTNGENGLLQDLDSSSDEL